MLPQDGRARRGRFKKDCDGEDRDAPGEEMSG